MRSLLLILVLALSGCQSGLDNVKNAANLIDISAPSKTYKDESNLWHYIANHQKLGGQNHQRVDEHIAWFVKHPDYLERVSRRAQPYLHLVVREVEKEGLPIEVALLPIVESAYYPFSYSHGTAVGLWQFIPSTGKLYGLEEDWWYAGRRDVLASTKAAVQYLKNLNQLFDGDWLLALAAYNAGPGRVQNAINTNKKSGKKTDFWHLELPVETRRYVPKLLAVAKILQDPSSYNQSFERVDNEAYLQAVELDSQFDLALIAQWTGLSIDEIYTFNPGLRRWATPNTLPFTLLLPDSVVLTFKSRLNESGERPQISWVRHQIQSGESLNYLASKYNTTLEQIISVNELRDDTIRAGDYIIVPLAQRGEAYYVLSEEQREKSRLNAQKSASKVIYEVVSGDSLWKIAAQFGTSINDLVRWNHIQPSVPLSIGKELVIWLTNKNQTALAKIAKTGLDITRKITYKVKSGDSLSKIASRYSVTVTQIREWNKLGSSNIIHPGQKLNITISVVNSSLS
ncbi:MAG: LysM peptidoglycan-binding domain-containing protein [Gammaproteobacteria bacterium]|nr:LysM peptidoglycan-binding domain-containing protein [Gammaproteobacteria bacterium]